MPDEVRPDPTPQPLAKAPEQDSSGPQLPPPELFSKFLDLQGRELELREKGLALEQVKQANAHDFAKVAIEHQSAYLRHDGDLRHGRFKVVAQLVAFGVLVLAVLLITLPVTGHEQLALEILKDLVLLGGGGAGGYGLAKWKSEPDETQPPQPSEPPEG